MDQELQKQNVGEDGKSDLDRAFEYYAQLIERGLSGDGSLLGKCGLAQPEGYGRNVYHGLNSFVLTLASREKGLTTPVFITANRLESLNWRNLKSGKVPCTEGANPMPRLEILEGEQPIPIIATNNLAWPREGGEPVSNVEYTAMSELERSAYELRPSMTVLYVYGFDQTNYREARPASYEKFMSDVEMKTPEEKTGNYALDEVDAMISKGETVCPVRMSKSARSSYYSPSHGAIFLSPSVWKAKESDPDRYYFEVFRLLMHASRVHLGFTEPSSAGKSAFIQANDRMTSEIGAFLLCRQYGIISVPAKESLTYLETWKKSLSEDPSLVRDALYSMRQACEEITNMVSGSASGNPLYRAGRPVEESSGIDRAIEEAQESVSLDAAGADSSRLEGKMFSSSDDGVKAYVMGADEQTGTVRVAFMDENDTFEERVEYRDVPAGYFNSDTFREEEPSAYMQERIGMIDPADLGHGYLMTHEERDELERRLDAIGFKDGCDMFKNTLKENGLRLNRPSIHEEGRDIWAKGSGDDVDVYCCLGDRLDSIRVDRATYDEIRRDTRVLDRLLDDKKTSRMNVYEAGFGGGIAVGYGYSETYVKDDRLCLVIPSDRLSENAIIGFLQQLEKEGRLGGLSLEDRKVTFRVPMSTLTGEGVRFDDFEGLLASSDVHVRQDENGKVTSVILSRDGDFENGVELTLDTDRSSAVASEAVSPMVRQFLDMKQKHPDALLLFRAGDFYEIYMQDAEIASNVLGITLLKKTKDKGPDGKPLTVAGFPYHALDSYLPKLIRAGNRIAICDQLDTHTEKKNDQAAVSQSGNKSVSTVQVKQSPYLDGFTKLPEEQRKQEAYQRLFLRPSQREDLKGLWMLRYEAYRAKFLENYAAEYPDQTPEQVTAAFEREHADVSIMGPIPEVDCLSTLYAAYGDARASEWQRGRSLRDVCAKIDEIFASDDITLNEDGLPAVYVDRQGYAIAFDHKEGALIPPGFHEAVLAGSNEFESFDVKLDADFIGRHDTSDGIALTWKAYQIGKAVSGPFDSYRDCARKDGADDLLLYDRTDDSNSKHIDSFLELTKGEDGIHRVKNFMPNAAEYCRTEEGQALLASYGREKDAGIMESEQSEVGEAATTWADEFNSARGEIYYMKKKNGDEFTFILDGVRDGRVNCLALVRNEWPPVLEGFRGYDGKVTGNVALDFADFAKDIEVMEPADEDNIHLVYDALRNEESGNALREIHAHGFSFPHEGIWVGYSYENHVAASPEKAFFDSARMRAYPFADPDYSDGRFDAYIANDAGDMLYFIHDINNEKFFKVVSDDFVTLHSHTALLSALCDFYPDMKEPLQQWSEREFGTISELDELAEETCPLNRMDLARFLCEHAAENGSFPAEFCRTELFGKDWNFIPASDSVAVTGNRSLPDLSSLKRGEAYVLDVNIEGRDSRIICFADNVRDGRLYSLLQLKIEGDTLLFSGWTEPKGEPNGTNFVNLADVRSELQTASPALLAQVDKLLDGHPGVRDRLSEHGVSFCLMEDEVSGETFTGIENSAAISPACARWEDERFRLLPDILIAPAYEDATYCVFAAERQEGLLLFIEDKAAGEYLSVVAPSYDAIHSSAPLCAALGQFLSSRRPDIFERLAAFASAEYVPRVCPVSMEEYMEFLASSGFRSNGCVATRFNNDYSTESLACVSGMRQKNGISTDDASFKKWFGDWQEHPESSGILDSTGKPAVFMLPSTVSVADPKQGSLSEWFVPFGLSLQPEQSSSDGQRVYVAASHPLHALSKESLQGLLRHEFKDFRLYEERIRSVHERYAPSVAYYTRRLADAERSLTPPFIKDGQAVTRDELLHDMREWKDWKACCEEAASHLRYCQEEAKYAVSAWFRSSGYDCIMIGDSAENSSILCPADKVRAAESLTDREYLFVGEKGLQQSMIADMELENLAIARLMEETGSSASNIKLATGWERGVDGLWRLEITDGQFKSDLKSLLRPSGNGYSTCALRDYLDTSLYYSYPGIRDAVIQVGSERYGSRIADAERAGANFLNDTITVNPRYLSDEVNLRSHILHEVQHLVQFHEGFSTGKNPSWADVDLEEYMITAELRATLDLKSNPRWTALTCWEDFEAIADLDSVEEFKGYYSRPKFYEIDHSDKAALEAAEKLDSVIKERLALAASEGGTIVPPAFRAVTRYPEACDRLEERYQDLKVWEKAFRKLKDSGKFRQYGTYLRAAGEVEARNVQARMAMTPFERLSSLASATADIAPETQISLLRKAGVDTSSRKGENTAFLNSVILDRLEAAGIRVELVDKAPSPVDMQRFDSSRETVSDVTLSALGLYGHGTFVAAGSDGTFSAGSPLVKPAMAEELGKWLDRNSTLDNYIKNRADGYTLENLYNIVGIETAPQEQSDKLRYLYDTALARRELSRMTVQDIARVSIPADTGENYLDWFAIPTSGQRAAIADSMIRHLPEHKLTDLVTEGMKNDPSMHQQYEHIIKPQAERGNVHLSEEDLRNGLQRYFFCAPSDGQYQPVTGRILYRSLSTLTGSDRNASGILALAGLDGNTIRTFGRKAESPRNHYVVYRSDNVKRESSLDLIRSRHNGVLGWAENGKICVVKDAVRPDVLVHEYTHLWAKSMQLSSPQQWNEIVGVMRQTKLWNEVAAMPFYRSVTVDENRLASECLARLSAEKNAAKLLNEASKAENTDVRAFAVKVRDTVNKFWGWVSENIFPSQQKLDITNVTDKVLSDLLSGKELVTEKTANDLTAARDAEYARAVSSGDIAKAEEMLNEEAIRKGLRIVDSDSANPEIGDNVYTDLKSIYEGWKEGDLLVHCRPVKEGENTDYLSWGIEPETGETVHKFYDTEVDLEEDSGAYADAFRPAVYCSDADHHNFCGPSKELGNRSMVVFVKNDEDMMYLNPEGKTVTHDKTGKEFSYYDDHHPVAVETGDHFTYKTAQVVAVMPYYLEPHGITYTEEGELIPLSQRFGQTEGSYRYDNLSGRDMMESCVRTPWKDQASVEDRTLQEPEQKDTGHPVSTRDEDMTL